ncbi:MAG: SPOR domain-containing protein [Bacteroidales bacterium]|jgi:hypothetical protein|nr:SPOR domain-containing protein [Bacteroidales bacterium]
MRYLKLTFLFFYLSGTAVFAQHKDLLSDLAQATENGGAVVMEHDSLLISLIALQREVNVAKGGVEGFSIRIYRGNDIQTAREGAEEVKAMFLLKYPDDVVYMEYVQPNWFVRVGDFKTYGEALKLRNELEKELSQIKDDIYIVPSTVKIK